MNKFKLALTCVALATTMTGCANMDAFLASVEQSVNEHQARQAAQQQQMVNKFITDLGCDPDKTSRVDWTEVQKYYNSGGSALDSQLIFREAVVTRTDGREYHISYVGTKWGVEDVHNTSGWWGDCKHYD